MIYLLQDCYVGQDGDPHMILKIGYSKKSFQESRQNHYDTHNYGYILLGERDGDLDLESTLHKKYDHLRLGNEWFQWSQEIIDDFWGTQPVTITKEEYFSELKKYVQKNLCFKPVVIGKTYSPQILGELRQIYQQGEPEISEDIDFDEPLLKKRINIIWNDAHYKILKFLKDFDIPSFLELFPDIQEILDSKVIYSDEFKKNSMILYQTIFGRVISEYQNLLFEKKRTTKILLEGYQGMTEEIQRLYLEKLKTDIKISQYSYDYIGVSKKTGHAIKNYFIELAENKALELIQNTI